MSQTIENRIVEMQFDNKQFESGVQESLSTLDKLKQSLKFEDAGKNLQDLGKNINKNMDLSGIANSIDSIKDRFSNSGIAMKRVIENLVDFAIEAGKKIVSALDAPFKQIRSGGWSRAMNIEDAKFQLKGLGVTWESVFDDIDYAVSGTAYGLDAAAKACSQLSASGVRAGEDMKAALRGISGVAAMGNTEYENISQIFTKAAGNGKVMADELNRISQYGLNARASLKDFFNTIVEGKDEAKLEKIPENVQKYVKSITKGTKVAEADISEFASKGKINFETFSYAMDSAFGEHAKKANETFMGAFRNIKAALSKIGAEFATPIIHGAIPVFNEIRVFLNDLRKRMTPLFEVFKKLSEMISEKLTQKLKNFALAFNQLGGVEHIGNALSNVFTSLLRIIGAFVDAFGEVFPKTKEFSVAIVDVTEGVDKLSEKFMVSENAAYLLKTVLVNLFTVLKDVGTIIKTYILPVVTRAVGIAMTIIKVIVMLIAKTVSFISSLKVVQDLMEKIRLSGGLVSFVIEKLRDAFLYLRDVLTDTSTVTGRVFTSIINAVKTLTYLIVGGLYMAFMKLKDVFTYFDAHDPLGSLVDGAKNLIDKLKELPVIRYAISAVEVAFGAVGLAVSKLVGLVKEFIINIKSGMSVVKAIGTSLGSVFIGAIGLFGKLKDAMTSCFEPFTKDKVIEENVEMPIYGATGALVGMEHELSLTKGEVKSTSTAFGKAKESVTKFGDSFIEKIKSIKAGQVLLFAFGVAVTVLTVNLSKLANSFTTLTKSVTGVTSGLAQFLKNFGKKHSSFAEVMLSLSIGIATLAASLWAMSKIPRDELIAATACLGGLLAVIGLFSVIGKKAGAGPFAAAMAAFSGGILMLVGALWAIDQVDMTNIEKKVIVLVAIIGTMVGVSAILSKIAPHFTKGSISILAFSGAVYVLAKALNEISKANLSNIKANYKELSVVILAFSVFASVASNVGVSAALGLLSFVLALKLLSSNTELVKKYSATIQNAFMTAINGLKAAVRYLYDGIKKVSEDMQKNELLAKVLQGSTIAVVGSIVAIVIALGHAGKGLKKAATGFLLVAASIAGLMYATVGIAKLASSIEPAIIDKAIIILGSVELFILALEGLMLIQGRNASLIKSNSVMMKDLRRLINSLSFLMLAIGGFSAMVGSLSAEEFERAKSALISTEIIIGVIAVLCTTVTAFTSRMGRVDVAFNTFAGVVLLIGSLVGSIAILMYMFSTVDWENDKTQLIAAAAAFVGIVTAVSVIIGLLARLKKNEKKVSSLGKIGTIIAVAALIGTIAGSLILMYKYIDDLKKAGIITLILVACLYEVTKMVVVLQATSRKLLNTKIRQKAFAETMAALGAIVLSLVGIGLTFKALSKVDPWRMAGQALILTSVLATLSSMVIAIQACVKNKNFSLTQTSARKFEQTMAVIGMYVLSFVGLAAVFYKLQDVDAGRMAGQAAIITGVLAALSGIVLGIEKFMKNADTKQIFKVEGTIAAMEGMFIALAAVSKYIIAAIPGDALTLLKKAEVITLILTELGGLASACGMIGRYIKIKEIAIGEVALFGLLAMFGLLTLIFKEIDKFKTEGIVAKSQAIILCLTELGALAVGCSMMWQYAGKGKIFAGEVALIAMVGIFAVLTQVFKVINDLKTEGIVAKSQAIILCLTELGVIGALLGLVFKWELLGAIGSIGLWDMLGAFAVLVQIFEVIDGLKTEGIMKKSQTIVLVMTELVILAPLMFADIAGLVGFAGLYAMLGGLAILAQIFVVIDRLKTEGIMKKSQTIVLVMLELEILAVIMALDVFGLIGFAGLYAMIGAFGALSAIFVIIDKLKVEGIMKKSQTIVLVMLELEILAVIMAADVFGNIGANGLKEMITAFGMLAQVFVIIDGLKTDGLLKKSQTIVLVMLELEILASIMVIDTFGNFGSGALTAMVDAFTQLTIAFAILGTINTEGLLAKAQTIVLVMLELEILASIMVIDTFGNFGSTALMSMVGAFTQLTLVFSILGSIKTEGLLAKAQTIVLVLLELEVVASLMVIDTLGTLGANALTAMVGAFTQLAVAFTVLNSIKTEGLHEKAEEVVLVLLQLEILAGVLGAIAPLAAAAQIGTAGIVDLCNTMVIVATSLAILNTIPLDNVQSSVDILIDTIWRLIPIGMAGTLGGPGLIALATGIQILANACLTAGQGLSIFAVAAESLVTSVERLVNTGPGLGAWFATVSAGVATLCSSVSKSVVVTANAIVYAIDTLIIGIITTLRNGARLIFATAHEIGENLKKGLLSAIDAFTWGMDFVTTFAQGMKSNKGIVASAASAIAKTLKDYLGHSGPTMGPAYGDNKWGFDFSKMFGDSMLDGKGIVENAGNAIAGVISDTVGSVDGFDLGSLISNGIGNGLNSGNSTIDGWCNGLLSKLGILKGEIRSLYAELNGKAAGIAGSNTRDDYLYRLQTREAALKKQREQLQKTAKVELNEFGKATSRSTNLLAQNQKELDSVQSSLKGLINQEVNAVDTSKDLTNALTDLGGGAKKAGKGAKEAEDEIANFYDSIASAINLFEEFNRETDLTSDKLISNMRSQVEGVTEWSNQIAKLAFMGIDQGLLQELADMGPQGYQYTNAFIHMTADQLAEANNLYHQSLMLPSKVTSQVYGSYTIAGRNAASGFLQGMSQEDIKTAAVGFAHQVVDTLNVALDIAAGYSKVTYKDGKAVVEGTSKGMENKYAVGQMEGIIKNLCDFNIVGGFGQELFRSNQIYNIGKSITEGIAKGMEDEEANKKVSNARTKITGGLVSSTKKDIKSNSPSKVFAEIGGYIVLGLAKGISDNTHTALNTMDKTADSIIDTMRDTINQANQALIDDINEPVITPILDLSQVQSGYRELDDMLSRNSALSASRSFTNLQNQQWNSQDALLNATMDNSDVVTAIGSLSEEVLSLKDAMTNIKMVLDTGTMVGAMTPAIDQELGMRQVYAGRGI